MAKKVIFLTLYALVGLTMFSLFNQWYFTQYHDSSWFYTVDGFVTSLKISAIEAGIATIATYIVGKATGKPVKKETNKTK